ncbi:hypothetical protein GCM10023212_21630 [Luteolibacter yonseiensis]
MFFGFLATPLSLMGATTYEWTFDQGDLGSSLGGGIMAAADATTAGQITYGTTDGAAVPHINFQTSRYLAVPALTGAGNGLLLTLPSSGPNGGGSYINDYSIIMDIYSPGAAGWQALFNTDTSNGNDADFYIDASGRLGIAALGYSTSPLILQNQWNRIAFVADLDGGTVKYFVNGTLAFTRTGSSMRDGRFALYSNANSGADLLLFNEGDTSGVYTHSLYVNSVGFMDSTLSDSAVAALGGANAGGIFVPEPGSMILAAVSCAGLVARRRRA